MVRQPQATTHKSMAADAMGEFWLHGQSNKVCAGQTTVVEDGARSQSAALKASMSTVS